MQNNGSSYVNHSFSGSGCFIHLLWQSIKQIQKQTNKQWPLK